MSTGTARTTLYAFTRGRTPVAVQADVSAGLVGTALIGGYQDDAIERARIAIINSGFEWPATKRVTVLLSPADLDKRGAHYDLPIALAILRATDQAPASDVLAWGELDLSGKVIGAPPNFPHTLREAAE